MLKRIFTILALISPSILAHAAEIKPDVERLLHRTGAEMNAIKLDEMGLSMAKTPEQPWTSSYWPDAIGGIATRYKKQASHSLSTLFGLLTNFKLNSGAWKNDNAKMKKKVLKMDEKELARNLSPSEKFDLLMGDLNFTLTNNIIDDIEYRFDHKRNNEGIWVNDKGLAKWNGICDGWTTASLHVPRPVKTIRVRGATGQMITFYPDDLKALASHLFARANQWMNIERVGNRCNEGKPKVDRQGTPIKDECRDIDAGLWHTTVMNRIGIDQRGFIIDIDNKTAVNNHPVFGYSVTYFNPITKKQGTLANSMIDIWSINDGKQLLRNPKATKLVGVEMHLDILNYAWPTGKETDGPEDDREKKRIIYAYDLEMTDDGEVLGGQFSTADKRVEKQPDMIWMLARNQLAWSRSSMGADEGPAIDPNKFEIWGNIDWRFKGDGAIPSDWFNAHKESSRFTLPANEPWAQIDSASPLAEMVYYLFDQARQK